MPLRKLKRTIKDAGLSAEVGTQVEEIFTLGHDHPLTDTEAEQLNACSFCRRPQLL